MDKIYEVVIWQCYVCGYTFMLGKDLSDCIDVDKITICPVCQNKLQHRTTWIKERIKSV